MALQLQTNYKGTTADYWRISRAKNDYSALTTQVTLSLYFSAESRAENVDNLIDSLLFDIDGVDLTRAAMYTIIKTLQRNVDGIVLDFSQAVDLI